ncbi:unnamed protein product [Vitrella brassicaformis CCMP3155]|uniref:Uncharacterized protein n=2 Tax=Vitrella brassicaformis TaxID=1169539 RepID=A0A0G4F5J1_VITBC|nr:unnamed protein product [Vitrella brassicaformis CCMP3155]|mmetsp:Transcript_4303/g.9814  ORF Transcript_4303/g.9814 Transcript_4303/m.9814 type:complete len:360 (+) Transcript_4303:28-1107(+)|eukprot:CEM07612.1 unnamed protein product [Vitrella brassicaformis CCMP3155]
MDTTNAPQIIPHHIESVQYTPFAARWVPHSPRFVILGQLPRATGCLKIYEMEREKLKIVADTEKPAGLQCGTFAASPNESALIATGDTKGNVAMWDIDALSRPMWSCVEGHKGIVNAIDGCGGQNIGYGAPELVTGGRDGCVRVWDPRQEDAVVALEPVEGETPADCWAVAFGNAHNEQERSICAGYDNGDVKLFDLRTMTLRWDTNVKNGVCGVAFDRKDINMNKLAVATLEQNVTVFDLRTFHPEEGYAGRTEKAHKSTVWGVHFLPQNRELFATCGGNGQINLYKYSYPMERKRKDPDNPSLEKGVAGTLELLNQKDIATQPIVSFDWHRDKLGLSCMACLDQTVRVVIVTKLDTF